MRVMPKFDPAAIILSIFCRIPFVRSATGNLYRESKMLKTAAIISTITIAVGSGSALAQQARVIRNPCERGPLPHVAIINGPKDKFSDFLQEVKPSMPREIADSIAIEICSDMSLVGDSAGLTARLHNLLKRYGY